jgi:hypothetical protein
MNELLNTCIKEAAKKLGYEFVEDLLIDSVLHEVCELYSKKREEEKDKLIKEMVSVLKRASLHHQGLHSELGFEIREALTKAQSFK